MPNKYLKMVLKIKEDIEKSNGWNTSKCTIHPYHDVPIVWLMKSMSMLNCIHLSCNKYGIHTSETDKFRMQQYFFDATTREQLQGAMHEYWTKKEHYFVLGLGNTFE